MPEKLQSSKSYGNFQNPFGLVLRMLKSGNRAAWSALFREGLSIAAKPFDVLLKRKDTKRILKANKSHVPLVLIVGPPRSGTTLTYQVLAYCLSEAEKAIITQNFPT